jgi:SAM-dependent methyltransferase
VSDDWSARAAAWAKHWARLADPARATLLDAADVGRGTRLLDVGCGSGELCVQAAERGATVAGIDAAEGMIAIARRRLPDGDLRVGAIEALPWADASFDVVTAVNALQFADDFAVALREAARVTRAGGIVAVCNWGRRADRDLFDVYELAGEPSPPSPIGEPGVLEERARAAGLDPVHAADVDVPWEAPDLATFVEAILDGAGFDATPAAIERAAAPFRRPDGSYRFENKFRYVIARAAI